MNEKQPSKNLPQDWFQQSIVCESPSGQDVLPYLPRTCSVSGVYVIGAGVHLYIYIYSICVYITKKKFEWHFKAVDSPIQTLAVDLLNL